MPFQGAQLGAEVTSVGRSLPTQCFLGTPFYILALNSLQTSIRWSVLTALCAGEES